MDAPMPTLFASLMTLIKTHAGDALLVIAIGMIIYFIDPTNLTERERRRLRKYFNSRNLHLREIDPPIKNVPFLELRRNDIVLVAQCQDGTGEIRRRFVRLNLMRARFKMASALQVLENGLWANVP